MRSIKRIFDSYLIYTALGGFFFLLLKIGLEDLACEWGWSLVRFIHEALC